MLRASLRSLLAHKLRLALSAVAVVLGVAFVAGSLIFTDTLGSTFTKLFTNVSADVTVTQKAAYETGFLGGSPSSATGVPESVLTTIRSVPGVRVAEGRVQVEGVYVVARDGKIVGGNGAPGIGIDWSATPGLSALRLVEGSAPVRAGQVAVDRATADKGKLEVGDTVRVLTPRGPVSAALTGIFRYGTSDGLAGATLTAFDPATARAELLGHSGNTVVEVAAAPGVSQQELKGRILAVVPAATYEAQTKAEQVKKSSDSIKAGLSFINTFLLVFAGIALFVGTFIILNTFSMLVAQRTRELALLRAIGASRGQVTRSVLLEALAVGLVGSTVGLGVGYLLAIGLKALFGAFGLTLDATLVLSWRTPVWAYVVGVLVTLFAAYLPARRASRIPPVAALREDATLPERTLHLRGRLGAALLLGGVVVLVLGFSRTGSRGALLVGVAAVLLIVAAIVLSPVLGRPVLAVLGSGFPRMFGLPGRLARENAQRNPRRTAATASALMIGLTLVAALSVIGASAKASVDKLIDRAVGADAIISNQSGSSFSTSLADSLRKVPGVASVSQERFAGAKIGNDVSFVTGIDPATVSDAVTVDMIKGSVKRLGPTGVLVSEKAARDKKLSMGSPVPMTFPYGGKRSLTVEGIFARNDALGDYAVRLETLDVAGTTAQDNFLWASFDAGADRAQVRASIEDVAKAYPIVTVRDQSEYKADTRKQVDQFLLLIYALLVLAVLIAVLGIVNTLALSVIERTREIGLLRAVGMGRGQLRRMVRLESLLIAMFGATLGVVLGLVFGIALRHTLRTEGIEVLSVPVLQLVVFFVLAGLVGILAALWPARRAARLDVLAAISTE